jgi:hypothetical protein
MSLLKHLQNRAQASFTAHPHKFFTEHDIHCELSFIATEFLRKEGVAQAKTLDGFVVNRVHHEYPTPFRCLMNGFEFRPVKEEESKNARSEDPHSNARRGYIDLITLNADYVSGNRLSVVTGKRYQELRASLDYRDNPALDLAVEVVYSPTVNEPHAGDMKQQVSSTIQDYQKLVALMRFTGSTGVPFCKEACMMFFSNTDHQHALKEKLASIPLDQQVAFFPILPPHEAELSPTHSPTIRH